MVHLLAEHRVHRVAAVKRLKAGRRLAVYVEPRDVWVGAYVAADAVYVCPLPLLVFRWTRGSAVAR
jgi:hypothetical protein